LLPDALHVPVLCSLFEVALLESGLTAYAALLDLDMVMAALNEVLQDAYDGNLADVTAAAAAAAADQSAADRDTAAAAAPADSSSNTLKTVSSAAAAAAAAAACSSNAAVEAPLGGAAAAAAAAGQQPAVPSLLGAVLQLAPALFEAARRNSQATGVPAAAHQSPEYYVMHRLGECLSLLTGSFYNTWDDANRKQAAVTAAKQCHVCITVQAPRRSTFVFFFSSF
jgi:hypothetical protein